MNKDVIYIEPEDDITDIIGKLKAAEHKVVALVPPKNIGVLRSAVNTKLISKTAKLNDKVAVIVTKDASLMKLAAVAGLPIAENLQSRPKMPDEISPDDIASSSSPISIDERKLDDDKEAPDSDDPRPSRAKTPAKAASAPKKADQELTSSDIEEDDKPSKKSNNKKGSKVPSLDKYRKWIILGTIGFVLLVGFIVWATVFAPAANISVNVRTTADNFSEEVSFTTDESKEDLKKGILYLETEEYKKDTSVDFSATGSKDVGEKAKGTLNVSVYVQDDTYSIPAGAEFATGDLSFTANTGATITFNDDSNCSNGNGPATIKKEGCLLSASVDVTAVASGDKYNVSTGRSWTSNLSGRIGKITNTSAFSGGTSKTEIFVQQSDVDSAKARLESGDDEAGSKDELKKKFGDDMIVINDSYSVEPTNIASNPAVGAEVGDNVTPKLTSTTVFKMSAVKKSSVEKYIKNMAKKDLGGDQKVYSVGEPFFEKYTAEDKKITARLKTTTQTGPKITENEILEKAKGKKVGEVQTLIKSINGVSSVKVDTSFFWVNSIPDDPNKIQIELKVEE